MRNAVSGFESVVVTNDAGEFFFNNLPLADYRLDVAASGFAPANLPAAVRSNVPLTVRVKLSVAAANASVEVTSENGELIDKNSSSTETRIDASRIERTANILRGRGLQRVVAQVSGVTTQNNGLVHIRSVEDGILYVVDGVPTSDRVD